MTEFIVHRKASKNRKKILHSKRISNITKVKSSLHKRSFFSTLIVAFDLPPLLSFLPPPIIYASLQHFKPKRFLRSKKSTYYRNFRNIYDKSCSIVSPRHEKESKKEKREKNEKKSSIFIRLPPFFFDSNKKPAKFNISTKNIYLASL